MYLQLETNWNYEHKVLGPELGVGKRKASRPSRRVWPNLYSHHHYPIYFISMIQQAFFINLLFFLLLCVTCDMSTYRHSINWSWDFKWNKTKNNHMNQSRASILSANHLNKTKVAKQIGNWTNGWQTRRLGKKERKTKQTPKLLFQSSSPTKRHRRPAMKCQKFPYTYTPSLDFSPRTWIWY